MALTKYQKKKLAIYAVFTAAVTALVIAFIVSIKNTYRDNDLHTQTVKEIELSPVSEAYIGKEDILGSSITLTGDNGEKATLTFPSVISEYHPEKAYILTNITTAGYDFKKGAEEMQENAPKLFKAFYGDSFDESGCSFVEFNELETFIREDYFGKNGEIAWYGVSGYSLIKDQYVFAENSQHADTIDTYFYKDHPDKTVDLPGGQITLIDAADMFSNYIKTTLSDFTFGYEVCPYKATISEYNGYKALNIVGEKLYEGIPFESCMSTFLSSNNGKDTSYGFSFIDADMNSTSSYFSISNQSNPIIARSEPLEKIISLKGAVEILKNNLAKNADYTFFDIKLIYSCKHTQNPIDVQDEDIERLKRLIAENNNIEDEYRPTWYFIIEDKNNQTSGIKVDALTGEITMDLQ